MKEKSENYRRFSTAKNACQKIESPSPQYKLRKLTEEYSRPANLVSGDCSSCKCARLHPRRGGGLGFVWG